MNVLFALALLIRGSAIDSQTLYTWGDELRVWTLPALTSRSVAAGPFGEGGCLFDMNGDGRLDLILQRGAPLGRLVWLEAPDWKEHTIDDRVEMHDCIGTSILGRPGVLMTQRHMQVRFYEPGGRMREIYSFYTASNQTGLCLADIDGDGRQDIVSGNYWIHSPAEFELPWKLFAINTHSETPESAMSRCAFLRTPDKLVISQGHMRDARLMLFARPSDPKLEWRELRLNTIRLEHPHALAIADGRIFVGDSTRLIEFTEDGDSRVFGRGTRFLAVFAWQGRVLAVSQAGPRFYRPPRR